MTKTQAGTRGVLLRSRVLSVTPGVHLARRLHLLNIGFGPTPDAFNQIADCLRISSKDDEEKTKTNSMHEGIHDYHYCSFDLEEKSFASRFSVNESKIAEYRIQRRSAWKCALACWQ